VLGGVVDHTMERGNFGGVGVSMHTQGLKQSM